MSETKSRTVAKIDITVSVDMPDPMPMMLYEEVGRGKDGSKDVIVNRNMNGNLLTVHIGKNGYVIDVGNIVRGLLAYENGEVTKSE